MKSPLKDKIFNNSSLGSKKYSHYEQINRSLKPNNDFVI